MAYLPKYAPDHFKKWCRAFDSGNPDFHFSGVRLDVPIYNTYTKEVAVGLTRLESDMELCSEVYPRFVTRNTAYQLVGLAEYDNMRNLNILDKGPWKSNLDDSIRAAINCCCLSLKAYGMDSDELQYKEYEIDIKTKIHENLNYNVLKQWDHLTQISSIIDSNKYHKNFPTTFFTIERSEKNNLIWYVKGDYFSITCTKNVYMFYYHNSDVVHILTREMILSIFDYLNQRFNCFLCSSIAEVMHIPHYLNFEELEKLYDWGDTILAKELDRGYELIKTLEPLCTGALQKATEDDLCEKAFFWLQMLHQSNEIIKTFDEEIKAKHESFTDWLLQLSDDTHKLSQVFGLFRSWMHPCIDEVDGAIALKKIVKKQKYIDAILVKRINAHFRLMFITSFYNKHGEWPKLKLIKHNSKFNYTWKCYKEGKNPPFIDYELSLIDLNEIEFDQNITINPTYNLQTLLSDKTLALKRSEMMSCIRNDLRAGTGTDRRVIISWLKNNLREAKELLDSTPDRITDIEHLIVLLKGKERELKTSARLFAMMTLEIRLYFVVTEELIAEHILPYFPQVTMKDDLEKLQKKIIENTSNQEQSKTKFSSSVICNIDFQKWNSNFRKEMVEGVFTSIDHFLGYPDGLINLTHKFFENSWISLSNSFLPNLDALETDFEENAWTWTGHLGGMEGIRQKGWTVFTIVLLTFVCRLLGLDFNIMGQGDNQVLIFNFPELNKPFSRKEDHPIVKRVKEKLEKFREDLKYYTDQIGLPVKIDETWLSSTLFAYGKVLVLSGVPCIMSMKKLTRLSSYSNESFPSLETSISSICANGMQACMSDVRPHVPFIMTNIHCCLAYLSHFEYSLITERGLLNSQLQTIRFRIPQKDKTFIEINEKLHDTSNGYPNHKLLRRLLFFPRILGGFPILLFPRFVIRGFPDPLSEAIAFLKKVWKIADKDLRDSIECMMAPHLNQETNLEMLVKDPVSLNLLMPTTLPNIIKGVVKKNLVHTRSDILKNNDIKMLLKAVQDEDSDSFFKNFEYIKPFSPRFFNIVFNASPLGVAEMILGKIESTATITKLVTKNLKRQLHKLVIYREKDYLQSVLYQIDQCNPNIRWNSGMCSTKRAQYLRINSWRRSDIVDVTVPCNIELFQMYYPEEKPCMACERQDLRRSYISFKSAMNSMKWEEHSLCCKKGPLKPYTGSRTVKKVEINLDTKVKNAAPQFHKMIKCLSCINWVTPNSGPLADFLKRMIKMYCELDIEKLIPPSSSVSGQVSHRLDDESTEHGGFINSLHQPYTHVSVSTDSAKDLIGGVNTNIHYQSAMIEGLIQYLDHIWTNINPKGFCHKHIECIGCIEMVETILLQGSEELLEYEFDPMWKNCKTIYIPKEVITDCRTIQPCREVPYTNKISESIGASIFASSLMCNVIRVLEDDEVIASRNSNPTRIIYYHKCNPINVLNHCSAILIGYIIDQHFFLEDKIPSKLDIKLCIERNIGKMNINNFEQLSYMLTSEQCRRRLTSHVYSYLPHNSHPPKGNELKTHMKDVLINHTIYLLNRKCPNLDLYYNKSMIDYGTVYFYMIYKLVIERNFCILINDVKNIRLYMSVFNTDRLAIITKDPDLTYQQIKQFDIDNTYDWTFHNMFNNTMKGYCNVSEDVACKSIDCTLSISKNTQKFELFDYHFTNNYIGSCNGVSKLILTNRYIVTKWIYLQYPYETVLSDLETEYFRLAKLKTAGSVKMYSLQLAICDIVRDSVTTLVLGDGEGGTSCALCRFNENLKITSHTHYMLQDILPGKYTTLIPSMLEYEGRQDNLVNYPLIAELPTDLTLDTDLFLQYRALGNQDLLVSDIEGKFWKNPLSTLRFIMNLEQLIIILNCKYAIIKWYFNFDEATRLIINVLRSKFNVVSVIRSKFSKIHTKEFYFVCKNPTRNKSNKLLLLESISAYETDLDIHDVETNIIINKISESLLVPYSKSTIPSYIECEHMNEIFGTRMDKTIEARYFNHIGLDDPDKMKMIDVIKNLEIQLKDNLFYLDAWMDKNINVFKMRSSYIGRRLFKMIITYLIFKDNRNSLNEIRKPIILRSVISKNQRYTIWDHPWFTNLSYGMLSSTIQVYIGNILLKDTKNIIRISNLIYENMRKKSISSRN